MARLSVCAWRGEGVDKANGQRVLLWFQSTLILVEEPGLLRHLG